MTGQSLLTKPNITALIWGIIGGISVTVISPLIKGGPRLMLVYAFILIASALTVKFNNRSNKKFNHSFVGGFLTFMSMGLIHFCHILYINNSYLGIGILGILWRLAVMAIFGIISSSIVSFFVKWI